MSTVPKQSDIRERSIDVIVVEDDADARLLLETSLTMNGCMVRAFANAEDAYDAVHARAPEVVITDLRLDGGSAGWTLAYALRADESTKDIPLIAVTGVVPPAREVVTPFDAYLCKPVDMAVVRDLIRSLCGQRRAARREAGTR